MWNYKFHRPQITPNELNRTIREICTIQVLVPLNEIQRKIKNKKCENVWNVLHSLLIGCWKMVHDRIILCCVCARKWFVCYYLSILAECCVWPFTIYHSSNRMNHVKFWFDSSHTSNHNIVIFLCLVMIFHVHIFTPWSRAHGSLCFHFFCGLPSQWALTGMLNEVENPLNPQVN